MKFKSLKLEALKEALILEKAANSLDALNIRPEKGEYLALLVRNMAYEINLLKAELKKRKLNQPQPPEGRE